MQPIRVMVIDDSSVVRTLLSGILSAEPDMEVAATAATGTGALAKLERMTVDVVTLDVEMPGMDGLGVLVELRRRYPSLPVIMFSALTRRAAATTMEALSLGAADYVTKPENTGSLNASIEAVREQLVPKIRTLVGRAPANTDALRAVSAIRPKVVAPAPAVARTRPGRVDVLAVASSTGGPNALATLFRQLPASFPVPIVVVQHMPPLFTKLLADRLTSTCPLRFHEAVSGEVISPGAGWLAPGDFHMRVERAGTEVRVRLDQGPQENSCRPAADVLFRSVADVYGGNVLGVVLTGMGQDGLRGSERLVSLGGRVLAQDEASSVVWGMPRFVAEAGLAEAVLPLDQLAGEILGRVGNGGASRAEGLRHAG
jgi:two-component system chemotaxis response regulator CheB